MGRVTLPVALAFAFGATWARAGPPDVAAALAARAGHPSVLHLRAEATVARDGETREVLLETAPGRRLERTCSADLCGGSWLDADESAVFGINGTLLPQADDEAADARTFAAIASTAFGEAPFRAAGGIVGEPVATGDLVRLRVRAPAGADLIAVADADTEGLVAVERPDGSPYRRLVASRLGSLTVYGDERFDRLSRVDGPLAAPAARFTTSVAATTTVPFVAAAFPLVPCRLGGQRARCLIDSGTTPSAVTLAFAERLGREPSGTIAIGGQQPYLTGAIAAGPLLLGGATLDGLRWAVIPRARDPSIDVVVGADALGALRVTFDAARGTVGFGASRGEPDGTPLRLSFRDGLPFAEVGIGADAAPTVALVDTGDAGTLSIGYDRYREAPGLFAVRTQGTARGLDGEPRDTLEGELDHLRIGELDFERVPIRAVRGQHAVHLGFGIAVRCLRWTLDFAQRRAECAAARDDTR